MKADTKNAPFSSTAPITIQRAEAGGFVVTVGGLEMGMRGGLYAACSTADETADLVRDMLKSPETK